MTQVAAFTGASGLDRYVATTPTTSPLSAFARATLIQLGQTLAGWRM